MEVNLLTLNMGNSRLGIGAFVAGELKYVNRVSKETRADWRGAIRAGWEMIAGRSTPAAAAISVNPSLNQPLEQLVEQIGGTELLWVGRDIELPIKVLTDNPQETGLDRILNVAAAFEQMGKACVVVDAGTAITIDCCNDNGDFLGGSIAPGAQMMLDALHQKTARLPPLHLAVPQHAFGRNTDQAMLHGVYHGIRGLVKETVESYATDLGFWPDIIATGGDAPLLFEGWELIHAIAPDLTFFGMALAYTNDRLKRES